MALCMAYEMVQRSAVKLCVRLQKLFVEMYSIIQQEFGRGEAASCTTTYT